MNNPQSSCELRINSRDLLKIAELYRGGGEWHGKRIVDEPWVKASTRPHARIDDQTEYGYLWWLKTFKSGDKSYPAFLMRDRKSVVKGEGVGVDWLRNI